MNLCRIVHNIQIKELFKPGMKLVRMRSSHMNNNIGEVLTVKEKIAGFLYFEEKSGGFHPSRFKKYE